MKPINDSVTTSETTDHFRSNLITFVFLGLFVVSLFGNAFQGWKIISLRDSLPHERYQPVELATGETIPTLSVKTVSGENASLSFQSSKKTVLYIFDPDCHWCARNLPNILFLAAQRSREFNFIGISSTSKGVKDYVDRTKLPFPIYVDSSTDDLRKFDFSATPQTIVILRNARVVHNWVGAYSGGLQSIIDEYFDLKLPGLGPGLPSPSTGVR